MVLRHLYGDVTTVASDNSSITVTKESATLPAVSPEGHVLHVDTTNNIVTVADESGRGVDLTVDANTQFFFRAPQNPTADSTPIATGTAFLTNHELMRGFKVHTSVVDPLAVPLVAQSIDIETAVYAGSMSAPDTAAFTLTRIFGMAQDDYVYKLSSGG